MLVAVPMPVYLKLLVPVPVPFIFLKIIAGAGVPILASFPQVNKITISDIMDCKYIPRRRCRFQFFGACADAGTKYSLFFWCRYRCRCEIVLLVLVPGGF